MFYCAYFIRFQIIALIFTSALFAKDNYSNFITTQDINLETDKVESILRYNPLIYVDNNGNYIGIWSTKSDDSLGIEGAIKLSTASNWSTPVLLSNEKYTCGNPKVVMNQNGQLLIAWVEKYQLQSRLCALCATAEGFNTTQVLTPKTNYVLDEFKPTINESGQMSIIWSAMNSSQKRCLFFSSALFNDIWSQPASVINNELR